MLPAAVNPPLIASVPGVAIEKSLKAKLPPIVEAPSALTLFCPNKDTFPVEVSCNWFALTEPYELSVMAAAFSVTFPVVLIAANFVELPVS